MAYKGTHQPVGWKPITQIRAEEYERSMPMSSFSPDGIRELLSRKAGTVMMSFPDENEFREYVQQFFDDRLVEVRETDPETGEEVRIGYRWRLRPTMGALAAHLGLSTKSLRNYALRDRYGDIVQAAKSVMESYLEGMMYDGKNPAGPMFALKYSFGWSEDGGPIAGELVSPLGELPSRESLEKDLPTDSDFVDVDYVDVTFNEVSEDE